MRPASAVPFHALPGQTGGWLDRLRGQRDKLLANPAFQRWAASFPLTRPIAHRRMRALFDLCAGFVYAQVLRACMQLHVFDLLAEGPQTAAALAPRLGLSTEAATRLLAAAVSLRLAARRRGGRFALGALGAACLGNPAVAAMVSHHALLYSDLADPVALLRGQRADTGLARFWAYAAAGDRAGLPAAQVDSYSALMAASQALVADDILDAYDVRRHTRLMDVGGGDGTFLQAVAGRAPSLGLMLFELPAVAQRAAARLGPRITAVGGDFFGAAGLPVGADIVTLVRVIHDHDDAPALALLRAAHAALPPGGRLLLAEPMAETPGAEPIGDAYFGFYLLAMGSGRPRSAVELRAMLAAAGFTAIDTIPTRRPLLVRLLAATATGPSVNIA